MPQAQEQAGFEPPPSGTAPESDPPVEQSPQDIAKFWLDAIAYSQKTWKDFRKRGRKIIKRYRDDVDQGDAARAGSKYNIFWSNVQTLAPATYSRRPKVEVTRRFRDADPVARVAGTVLQRALQYEVDKGLNFHRSMQSVVLDRLLPGLGVLWVRYEPAFQTKMAEVPDPENPVELKQEEYESLTDEFTPIDYVFWEDFACGPARTWADVPWVARQVPFTKEGLKKRFEESCERFGGNVDDVPANYDPVRPALEEANTSHETEEINPELKRALVWEIWDRDRKQTIFISKGYQFPLDIVDDRYELEEFFPCPEPLRATTTNDEMVPVPDFVIYQSQIRELDQITNRISLLQSALRVIGVYDSSQDALKDLLQSGLENRMVPVNAWGAFAEKGGLKGVTDFLPLDQVVKVLEGLYQARDTIKQIIYEITGMSDIIRGASVASETLGAQQIKAKFANLRLSSRQQQVAEFVTEVLQIKAQLVCNLYSPDTLKRISSADQIEEVKANPRILDAAIAFLKDKKLRSYRIEIESQSMLELDEVDEQKRRNEFMSMLSNFFLAMKNIIQVGPEMAPVALEMLKFSIRGFPVGRSLESVIEDAAEKIKKRLAQPKPQGPSPDQIKLMVAQLKDKGDTLRTLIEENASTDREELKAALEVAISGMQADIQAIMGVKDTFDQMNDQDAQMDLARFQSSLNPPQQPKPGQPPQGQPGMPPQGAPQ